MELSAVTGFEWDAHNTDRNRAKHFVESQECEEVFFHEPLVVVEDAKHSQDESRFHALGKTSTGRRLLLVFTIRADKIRVISARPMSRKEREIYEYPVAGSEVQD